MRPSIPAALPALLGAVLAGAPGCGAQDGGPSSSAAIVADHTRLDAGAIPQAGLDAARALRMNLQHASVGANVWDGLDTLAGADAGRYAKPAWVEENRGNPGWEAKISGFVAFVEGHADEYDVFQMKLCYIDEAADFATYRGALAGLEAAYPSKRFVWWTMPITTEGGENVARAAFNHEVRAHVAAHGGLLFDLAAIESHDASGGAVTEGGVEAMYGTWSSDGGHLSAAGAERAAKAMWWLMARAGGWDGG